MTEKLIMPTSDSAPASRAFLAYVARLSGYAYQLRIHHHETLAKLNNAMVSISAFLDQHEEFIASGDTEQLAEALADALKGMQMFREVVRASVETVTPDG